MAAKLSVKYHAQVSSEHKTEFENTHPNLASDSF